LDPERWEQEVPTVAVDHFGGEIVIVMVTEDGINGGGDQRKRAIGDDAVLEDCVVDTHLFHKTILSALISSNRNHNSVKQKPQYLPIQKFTHVPMATKQAYQTAKPQTTHHPRKKRSRKPKTKKKKEPTNLISYHLLYSFIKCLVNGEVKRKVMVKL
jgi:hypothetical protein